MGMLLNLNKSTRILPGLLLIAVLTATALLGAKPADAGGMGGINVRPAVVCLNGIRFFGTASDANALNRTMTAEIFAGQVGSPVNLKATGNSRVFTAVGQARSFAIYYPVNTFHVGDSVTYSVLSNDGSGYGGGQFGTVRNCRLWHW